MLKLFFIIDVLFCPGKVITCNLSILPRAIYHWADKGFKADYKLREEHVERIRLAMLPIVCSSHPIILFHAAESLVDCVKGPNV